MRRRLPRTPAEWLAEIELAIADASEAKPFGKVNVAADSSKEIPTRIPAESELKLTPGAAYVHITSNETIAGSQSLGRSSR